MENDSLQCSFVFCDSARLRVQFYDAVKLGLVEREVRVKLLPQKTCIYLVCSSIAQTNSRFFWAKFLWLFFSRHKKLSVVEPWGNLISF